MKEEVCKRQEEDALEIARATEETAAVRAELEQALREKLEVLTAVQDGTAQQQQDREKMELVLLERQAAQALCQGRIDELERVVLDLKEQRDQTQRLLAQEKAVREEVERSYSSLERAHAQMKRYES